MKHSQLKFITEAHQNSLKDTGDYRQNSQNLISLEIAWQLSELVEQNKRIRDALETSNEIQQKQLYTAQQANA